MSAGGFGQRWADAEWRLTCANAELEAVTDAALALAARRDAAHGELERAWNAWRAILAEMLGAQRDRDDADDERRAIQIEGDRHAELEVLADKYEAAS